MEADESAFSGALHVRPMEDVKEHLNSRQQQELRYTCKGKDVAYLRKLVGTIRPLVQNCQRYPKITIYVVDSPHVDAQAFPGGTLFFYRGLLTGAENEAAVAWAYQAGYDARNGSISTRRPSDQCLSSLV